MNISRRKIIKSLGMVAGATATGIIPGITLFANDGMEKGGEGTFVQKASFSAVLIGSGERGWRFGKFSLKQPEQLQIIAVAEPLADRRKHAAESLGLPAAATLNSWKELIEKKPRAQVAIIASSGNYMQACANAILAGYDVWVDRPVSMEPQEVIAINKLARENKRQLHFCFIHEGKLNLMDHKQFEKNPAKV
jgi:hypothetical protein